MKKLIFLIAIFFGGCDNLEISKMQKCAKNSDCRKIFDPEKCCNFVAINGKFSEKFAKNFPQKKDCQFKKCPQNWEIPFCRAKKCELENTKKMECKKFFTKIYDEIAAQNFCEKNSDCADLQNFVKLKTASTCQNFVNKNADFSRLKNLMKIWQQKKCPRQIYGKCAPQQNSICKNGKCDGEKW